MKGWATRRGLRSPRREELVMAENKLRTSSVSLFLALATATLVSGVILVVTRWSQLVAHSAFLVVLILIISVWGSVAPSISLMRVRTALRESTTDGRQAGPEMRATLNETLGIAIYPMISVLGLLFLIATILGYLPAGNSH
jgi:hypothetical protein